MRITSSIAANEVSTLTQSINSTAATEPTLHAMPKDRAQMSGPGAMLGKLQALKEQDPAAFSEKANEIAEKLRAGAANMDDKESAMFQRLADQLSNAAETGDLSALEPKGPPGGGRPHGPPGARPAEGATEAYQGQSHAHGGPSDALKSLMDDVLGELGG